ncbi:MAG: class I SAM-dependent methyltransferase [Candidatus Jettenia sp.]|uniref:Putative methyltransferase n=1 Tax=Candidatus Jettenia caeni TaxID=247490 RepID=I3IIR8_9BACT|nr:class I SAM-dependent methyltransferase [Candidatus Jettenia sp. AMX1]MBC6930098.1 class I SAM-dependent methyltransferase [Candidatus Jettenia sp.]GAB61613.1 putative methyltransferase [Candidatus Jettenia caeni]KAA0248013.1 MAG: class I SAM-dependent methyltransferase [Candidatus Jettenia sp. AMX1]MCE7881775.1 class I SAM-dependent methyltransferase [Candidatus Jettenia sp. AMX1]MCQ3928397.1 class I SAM-dependent methyltransferase [Candidatus Jettenia sp.]
MLIILRHPDGLVHIEQSRNTDKNIISVELHNKRLFMPISTFETTYPWELIKSILQSKGPACLCDEIMKDEDPCCVQHQLQYTLLSYVSEKDFENRRILDFGCGAGASSIVLSRMLPNTEIVGIELDEKLLYTARLRAEHYQAHNIRFIPSPDGNSIPDKLGKFDYIILSAVYEHLLPHERKNLLPKLWAHLNSGGVMFINQTPNRLFPIELHTTHLPLINYLPDKLALLFARMFSKRVIFGDGWETLLRKGIRGGTVSEITDFLYGDQKLLLLEPAMVGVHDSIDIWYRLTNTKRLTTSRKLLKFGMKFFKFVTGIQLTPCLSLALKKL